MPRRRWRLKARREPLSGSLRFHLETGEYPKKKDFPTWADVWFTKPGQFRALWQEFGVEITAAWVLEHAGSRPWGWWQHDATAPRACLEGAQFVWPPGEGDWVWRQEFGLPGRPQARKPGAEPARLVFEAEATYLRRLGLLLPGEAARLTDEDFEPEIEEIPELPVLDQRPPRPPSVPALASSNGRPRRPAT